ncbi:MAG: glycosyltransferase [Deltaproteobacteria bacterium]|nr:glycosyltransferase [Deltaproteobacteria bacterium]
MKGVIKVFGSNIPTLPLVKILSRRPMMVTYQFDYAEGTRMNDKKGLKYLLAPLLERLALWPADLVLVTAKWLEEKIQTVYAKKTILLPNWVDLSSVALASKEVVRNNHLILYAGRLNWIKGINVLIDAFARVKLLHPDARLVICGAGEEEEKLCAQAEALGLTDVQFKGRVSNADVLELMQSAAIFVLPTLTMEGHPKSLIEAMVCGAACIVSNVPGNSDAIIDGETGLLFPPGDVDALAGSLNCLLKDSNLRKRLSSNAHLSARTFNFAHIVNLEIQTLHNLYVKLPK